MPIRDIQQYLLYTNRRMFPGRRVELGLARVPQVAAQLAGNKQAKLSDFLFDPQEETERDLSDLLGQPIEDHGE